MKIEIIKRERWDEKAEKWVGETKIAESIESTIQAINEMENYSWEEICYNKKIIGIIDLYFDDRAYIEEGYCGMDGYETNIDFDLAELEPTDKNIYRNWLLEKYKDFYSLFNDTCSFNKSTRILQSYLRDE